ncbi:MAG: cytochrome P450 [Roseiflexaceae bacterium]|nr:cytochrome P450 [Roseiflexaceae bacterium]
MSAVVAPPLPLPPGSFGLPLVGEMNHWWLDPLRFAQDRHARYGPVFRTHLLGRPCAVLLGPEANRFMLSSHMHLFSSRAGWSPTLISLIGNGLSLIDGAHHRRHRTMIMPALHATAIPRYFTLMQRLVDTHAQRWLQQGQIKLFEGFKHLSFDIATAAILGMAEGPEAHAFADSFHVFSRGLFALPAWKSQLTPYGRAWQAGTKLRASLARIIAARRAAPDDSVLGLLLAASDAEGQGFTDAELVDELLVLLWAGHDTITSLLTWVYYELLRQPDVLARARAEQARVLSGGALEPQHLKQLPQLDRILREAERLHPPAPGGFRGVVEEFAYGGYRIPAGWTVMYSSVFTHMMPELWYEPQRFDPERFAPPREEGNKPFHLIGFGAGPRVCVGLAFAQMQMRVVLSHLLQTLEFELLPNQSFRPIPVPTKMPLDGLKVFVR